MNTLKILGVISLLLVLTGFFMPWVDIYYGYPSGFEAVRIGLDNIIRSGFYHLLSTLIFLTALPVSAIFFVFGIFFNKSKRLYLSAVIADLTMIYAIYMVIGWPKIFVGFYIMAVGVLLINYIAIKVFIERKNIESGKIT